MKNIKFMGLEYNERMINVLSDYDKFMSDSLLNKVDDGGYINIFEIATTRNEYLERLSEDDKAVLKHFMDSATIIFNKKNRIRRIRI